MAVFNSYNEQFFEYASEDEEGRKNDHQHNRRFKKLCDELKTEHKHSPIGLLIACAYTLILSSIRALSLRLVYKQLLYLLRKRHHNSNNHSQPMREKFEIKIFKGLLSFFIKIIVS
jgi:hypothetical protein